MEYYNIDFDHRFNKSLKCPICRNKTEKFDTVPTIDKACKTKVDLRRCTSCAHIHVVPFPLDEVLRDWYTKRSRLVLPDNWNSVIVDRQHLSKGEKVLKSKLMKLFEKEGPCNYLEIGIGGGLLFEEAKEIGFDCWGVEPGQWSSDEKLVPKIEDLNSNLKFDIIVALDVLEHVSEPEQLIKDIREVASSRAHLFLQFPRGDGPDALLRKGNWPMVTPFSHIHFFSRYSTTKMLQQNGWEIIKLAPARREELKLIFKYGLKSVIRHVIELFGGSDLWFVHAKARNTMDRNS